MGTLTIKITSVPTLTIKMITLNFSFYLKKVKILPSIVVTEQVFPPQGCALHFIFFLSTSTVLNFYRLLPNYFLVYSPFNLLPLISSAFHAIRAKFPSVCSSTLFIQGISLPAFAANIVLVVFV